MKAIRIYTQDSKYFMEDLGINQTVELTNVRFDKKSNKHWIDLPENCIGQKAICKEMVDEKLEVVKQERNIKYPYTSAKTSKTPKVDLNEYYTDEERAQIEKLQSKIDKINEAAMARAQKDLKKNELKDTLKALDPDTLKAIMAELMGGEA